MDTFNRRGVLKAAITLGTLGSFTAPALTMDYDSMADPMQSGLVADLHKQIAAIQGKIAGNPSAVALALEKERSLEVSAQLIFDQLPNR